MKKIIYVLGVVFFLVPTSCVNTDLEDETGIEFAIDKENVESPGGQSGATSEGTILQKIDKEDVEPPGGQG
ncbi:hypothetical protein [Aquimarina latercula]|uniref:hypothetical protein n=1 Tax=Aquimarina latercula TaxID=987 RepID=UPI000411C700|nr:hypothetical protein [Aquimarina latercula]